MEFERIREARTITMNQMTYVEEVLKHFNMEECKPIGTPFNVNSNLLKLSDEKIENVQREMEDIL
jgi:hypothetical protein